MAKYQKINDCTRCPYTTEYANLINSKDLNKIEENCIIVKFKKGENICKRNIKASHLLFLSEGLVKIYTEGEKKNSILDIIKDGTFIGIQTIFGQDYYNFSASAIEESKICMIDINIFKEICLNNKKLLIKMAELLAESTASVLNKISFCNTKSIKEKLAYYLLWFANEIYKSDNFVMGLSRQEIANFIGSSRENTVRVLSEMIKEGLIETDRRNIKIIEKDILKAIAKTF
jgi:CRP-like cAMP-binding protein